MLALKQTTICNLPYQNNASTMNVFGPLSAISGNLPKLVGNFRMIFRAAFFLEGAGGYAWATLALKQTTICNLPHQKNASTMNVFGPLSAISGNLPKLVGNFRMIFRAAFKIYIDYISNIIFSLAHSKCSSIRVCNYASLNVQNHPQL